MPRAIPPSNNWLQAEAMRPFLMHQRTEMLLSLARGPVCVYELADEVDLDIRQVSEYLMTLRRASLVCCESHGRHHIYTLSEHVSVERDGGHVVLRLNSAVCQLVVRVLDPGVDLTARAITP